MKAYLSLSMDPISVMHHQLHYRRNAEIAAVVGSLIIALRRGAGTAIDGITTAIVDVIAFILKTVNDYAVIEDGRMSGADADQLGDCLIKLGGRAVPDTDGKAGLLEAGIGTGLETMVSNIVASVPAVLSLTGDNNLLLGWEIGNGFSKIL